VQRVLGEDSYRRETQRIAAAMRALPSAAAALDVLSALRPAPAANRARP
jgi:UDP:flavonoid glycosyltransferase YjiC (YdhE family)